MISKLKIKTNIWHLNMGDREIGELMYCATSLSLFSWQRSEIFATFYKQFKENMTENVYFVEKDIHSKKSCRIWNRLISRSRRNSLKEYFWKGYFLLCPFGHPLDFVFFQSQAVRVTVSSLKSGYTYPLLVVVRQQRGVLSWQLPLEPPPNTQVLWVLCFKFLLFWNLHILCTYTRNFDTFLLLPDVKF